MITADDDTLYPYDWVEKLYAAHLRHPKAIVCFRAREIQIKDGRLTPYMKWPLLASHDESNKKALIFTGKWGVLYPSTFFYDLLRSVDYQSLAPLTDDVVFSFIAITTKTRTLLVESEIIRKFEDTAAHSIIPLYEINCGDGPDSNNDRIESLPKL